MVSEMNSFICRYMDFCIEIIFTIAINYHPSKVVVWAVVGAVLYVF
jgi:hypothetical protein